MKAIPKYHEFFNPLLKAIHNLGGSGSLDEINEKVLEIMHLPHEVLEVMHDPEHSNITEVEYRLAWARTYLKKFGFLENSSRGVWALAKSAEGQDSIDPKEVVKAVQELTRSAKQRKVEVGPPNEEYIEQDDNNNWRKLLFAILTKQLDPSGFERLIQRLLRESGFVQVEVTGRTGDGGIDGKGIARIHGLLSFHVVFQCKRYQGVVSPSQIRDFRGAMVGRTDKGLFITTGTFSKEAIREATRDGAPPIDLLDGDALANKLKELGLGIKVKMVEEVLVDDEWFKYI